MPQEDVFELTAAVTVVLEDSADSFEFQPTTFEPSEEPVEEMSMMADWWTEEALLADPEMVAFYEWRDTMEAFLAAPTLEEQLAIAAPYQTELM